MPPSCWSRCARHGLDSDASETPHRRSTPRHHNPDEGYGSPPDGSRLAGEFALARRSGTATIPFSVADSSPSPGDAAGGGGGTPEPEGGSAANRVGSVPGARRSRSLTTKVPLVYVGRLRRRSYSGRRS
ncbi:unnamed protein product [Ectocarpus sp. CCAP 1310/34]|nr:unnamed protein product [Ectocarpus sp. CCAP 1310/34]